MIQYLQLCMYTVLNIRPPIIDKNVAYAFARIRIEVYVCAARALVLKRTVNIIKKQYRKNQAHTQYSGTRGMRRSEAQNKSRRSAISGEDFPRCASCFPRHTCLCVRVHRLEYECIKKDRHTLACTVSFRVHHAAPRRVSRPRIRVLACRPSHWHAHKMHLPRAPC